MSGRSDRALVVRTGVPARGENDGSGVDVVENT